MQVQKYIREKPAVCMPDGCHYRCSARRLFRASLYRIKGVSSSAADGSRERDAKPPLFILHDSRRKLRPRPRPGVWVFGSALPCGDS